jgi:hypothetical protein
MKGIPWSVDIRQDLSHAPITSHLHATVSNIRPSMIFIGCANGTKCKVVMDSGANEFFTDLQFAKTHGFKIIPTFQSVKVVNGHGVLCHTCLPSPHI